MCIFGSIELVEMYRRVVYDVVDSRLAGDGGDSGEKKRAGGQSSRLRASKAQLDL